MHYLVICSKQPYKIHSNLSLTFRYSDQSVQFSSVTRSCQILCDPMDCSMPSVPVHRQPTSSCRWCHSTISFSVFQLSSCLKSFPASGSFPRSQFFTSGGQSIGVSASISELPMNIQDWFPLGWIGWFSLQSKGLSRVFSNTIVQKHKFFGSQISLYSNSNIQNQCRWWFQPWN